ncbi:MAG: SUMF1/EgtB/PvdO family nonheme iron enzyme [Verrucomicrobiales bacterium]|nr:SUMF1/EgtB/PvdO family nonheme iron enzyme [Verrucomicrobiales bacterium]
MKFLSTSPFLLLFASAALAAEHVDFVKEIQPLFEMNCVGCHTAEKVDGGADGELDMTTLEKIIEGGEHGSSLEPGKPDESRLYKDLIRNIDDKKLMPPKKTGGPLLKEEIEKIRLWIEQGAVWPQGVVLRQRPKEEVKPPSPDNLDLVRRIREKILATQKEKAEADMHPYTGVIPNTKKEFKMVAIKGGSFLLGSPDTEAGRKEDEGPQVSVKIDPFWIGACEVTWDQYMPFMITSEARWKDGSKKQLKAGDSDVDIVSSPTTPYTDMTFGMGQDNYPAISMTEHAASKFCQWLSAQTGQYYRLPTEAEWEYAARAGTATAYFFGDDAAQLADYAWFRDNSDSEGTGQGKTQPVGQKKPNPWGLFDVYGNVAEWTLDQLDEGRGYAYLATGKDIHNPFNKPVSLYPRVVRGGGYKSPAEACRSASRRGSREAWKQQDPQLPKSIWYHTDAQFLGFRVVRPLQVPSAEDMYFMWNCGTVNQSK